MSFTTPVYKPHTEPYLSAFLLVGDFVSTSTTKVKLPAAAALTFVAALTIACGSSSRATPTPTLPTPTPSATVASSPTPAVRVGAPITPADASTFLPMALDDTHYWSPMGGYGSQIVVAAIPSKGPNSENEPWQYSLWDPVTGSTTPEWTDAPRLQETYMQSDGDWVETVTRGFGGTAAMADWTIILRNLKTGEERDVAKAQPGQGEINLTQITLQNDPDPSLAGGKLVWASAELLAGEGVQSTVQMYDIASGATTTVEIKTDHAREDLWSASTGGGKVAWLDGDGTEFRIIILDVASGRRITLGADATASQAKLTPDGRYLVLETRDEGGSYDKYLIDVGTGEKRQLAGAQGGGVFSTTRYVSWDTATMESSGYVPSGLYALQTHELRSLTPDHTTLTNVGHVMGDWFIWQSMPLDPASSGLSKWYAMRLPD
jgi:hypothetical protein